MIDPYISKNKIKVSIMRQETNVSDWDVTKYIY